MIHFHQSQYQNFKAYYNEHLLKHLRSEFPNLVSYSRFVEFMPTALIPLSVYLRTVCFGTCTGFSFTDSTSIDECDNRRIAQHRVLAGLAERGRTSTGWFFGFKLHLVFNDRGEILNVMLTSGNVDDRKPVPVLVRNLFGKLIGDRGYISQIEHSRHRNLINFLSNLVCGLIAYCRQPKKPSLSFHLPIVLLP